MKKTILMADPFCLRHLTGFGHPESPNRYQAIDASLASLGLDKVSPRQISEAELHLCHTREYIQQVTLDVEKSELLHIIDGSYTLSTGDVQICPDSWRAALVAAGGALTGVDLVMQNKAQNVFSYLRPPGHHACSNQGMGFCIFNNAALAARYAQKKYGLKQVLIVDWDVHHGNGTQEIFEADPTVFYFSTHQQGIYPGTGHTQDRGVGQAVGSKLNVPIAPGPNSRKLVIEAFQGPLLEAMQSFKPEFIIISAGFDAHHLDPLGGLNLTEQDFGDLTQIVMGIADQYSDGRIVSLLEGGYDLRGLAASAVAHVSTLASHGVHAKD